MIVDEPIWKELKPYVWKEPVTNQPLASGDVRYRRKVSGHIPRKLLDRARKVRTPCVACGDLMRPIQGVVNAYINVTCNFDKGTKAYRCARKISKVKPAILRLEAAIDGIEDKDPRQAELEV